VGTGGAISATVELSETGVAGHAVSGRALAYWVLDGTLTVRAGGEELAAGPESFVLVPPPLAHTVAGPARVVSISA
jgi:mannose-6-phosphate isomerase-like protein (cupin superfamily)